MVASAVGAGTRLPPPSTVAPVKIGTLLICERRLIEGVRVGDGEQVDAHHFIGMRLRQSRSDAGAEIAAVGGVAREPQDVAHQGMPELVRLLLVARSLRGERKAGECGNDDRERVGCVAPVR